ncbi:MAG: tetratricopeptide repeat protein [Acidobacteria bacterium]|nr:tetratricopeptide repeat protein [Acidobacteriota bacterium]
MSYRTRVAAAVMAGVLVATAASAQAWAGRGRLSGNVQDPDGNPVEGASVKLTLDGAGPDAAMTNRRGRWALAGVRSGNWIAHVSKAGYIPTEHEVYINEYATSSDRVTLRTTLEPGGPSDGAAGLAEDEAAQAARDLLEQGNDLIRQGDHEGAIAAFREALPSVPDASKAAVLVTIAGNQVSLERDEEAIESLKQALDLAPTNVDALQLMSRRLTAMGRAEEAKAYLERLPEDLQADPEILVREGVALYNQNDFAGSVSKLTTAIDAAPDWVEAYYFRGLANMAAGENAAAAADFRKLLELEPEGERAEEAKQFAEYLESL